MGSGERVEAWLVRAGLLLLSLVPWCASGATPKRVLVLDSFVRDAAPAVKTDLPGTIGDILHLQPDTTKQAHASFC